MDKTRIASGKSDFSAEFFSEFSPEGSKTAFIDGIPDLFHKIIIIPEIVHNAKSHSEHFFGFKQMSYICP